MTTVTRATPLSSLTRRQTGGSFPLSFAQEKLWFLNQLEPESPYYNILLGLRFCGALDAEALRKALEAVIERHQTLRTTFVCVDDVPKQVVREVGAFEMPTIDVSSLADNTRDAELQRLAIEAVQRPFELQTDLMIRATLVRLRADEHVLLLVLHHIATDGWSSSIMYREISQFYAAYVSHRTAALAELPIQYTDFAVWQREQLEDSLAGHLAYWKQQLEGAPELHELPTDHPRPPRQSHRGRRETLRLPASTVELLKRSARHEGVSLFMTMLAALQILLHRYSGSDDIVVGAPITNRTHPELEELIGFFVNTLVLRNDLSGNPTFRELLQRVRQTTIGAYDHQDLPFEKLVEALHPSRSLSHSPLVQVMFAFQNVPTPQLEFPGLAVTHYRPDDQIEKFDLTVFMDDADHDLEITFAYNTELFEATTIQRMLGHYRNLLDAVVKYPDRRIGELPMMSNAEVRQVVCDWNDTRRDYPQLCVHQLFEAQAQSHPEVPALLFAGEQLTYHELNQRANTLAHHLQAFGVGPETCVGICIDRSPEFIIAMLATLKAGGAYVPLDPSYPRERLVWMVEDSGVKVLLTTALCAQKLPAPEVPVIRLDLFSRWNALEDSRNIAANVGPQSLAYIMYTSGSTGTPKGVEIRHCGIVRLLMGVDYVRLSSEETILQLAPTSFDASTFEIWGALLHGARLVLCPSTLPSTRELAEVIREYGVTTMWLTASLFNAIIDADPGALSPLRQLLIGGEALSVSHVQRALAALPNTQIINGYGPTESTTFACCYPVPRGVNLGTSVPIGRPIANTTIYLLDRNLQPVPVGVAGEIHIGGDGLAIGYIDERDLTETKFIRDAFSGRPGARLYRTGDQARYLPDGNIEFLGRLDYQVKIRGFRIELREIEAVLTQHPAVKTAIVVVHGDSPDERTLVAYVVEHPGCASTAVELRNFLQRKLPDYMLPSCFVCLSALPMLSTGKVDRQALPAAEKMLQPSQHLCPHPRDPLESQLADIWRKVLGREQIGIRDNFFDIGGNSLLAIRIINQIERTCGRRLPVSTMFTRATIEQLAEVLRAQKPDKLLAPTVKVDSAGSHRPLFFFHGDYIGGGFYCLNLARLLGDEHPLYPVQPHGIDGDRVPPTIEAMAADHLGTLRAVQPKGPYLLGGHCNGGLVAFEIARQLQRDGETVKLLVIIDASAQNARFRWLDDQVRRAGRLLRLAPERQLDWFLRFRRLIIRVKELPFKERMWFFLSKSKHAYELLTKTSDMAVVTPAPGTTVPIEQVTQTYLQAATGHVPRRYDADLVLLRSEDTFKDAAQDPTVGWRDVARHVEVHVIPGGHLSCLTTYIAELAEKLRACLQSVNGNPEP